jgi:hypothetical protein
MDPLQIDLHHPDHPGCVVACTVAICGSICRVQFGGLFSREIGRGKRGDIGEFSREARKRLLTFIARVDWRFFVQGMFLTLTYPDDVADVGSDQLNQDKYLMHRFIEKENGHNVPGIWRLEYQTRKTGRYVGKRIPHFHLLLCNADYIRFSALRAEWKKIIRTSVDPQVNVRRIKNSKMAGLYVSKYCCKASGSSFLDNAVYLNKPRRNYGYMRKADIPLHDTLVCVTHDPILMRLIEELGAVELPWVQPGELRSFDLFGDRASQVIQAIADFSLDSNSSREYDW